MSEPKPEYLKDAEEMIGKGYPSLVIEPARTISARHNGKMVEVEEPAWVKFSTDFKAELANFDEYSLKVFIYIGLSVNWQTGVAYPGTRKIAEGTQMNKDTVSRAVSWLEEKGYLTIQKRDGSSNIYKPVRFISIGTVRPERTAGEEPSDETSKPSDENGEPSDGYEGNMHNKNNKKEQEHSQSAKEIDVVAEYLKMAQFKGAKKEIRVDAILSYFGETLRRTTTSREWEDFAKWVDTRQMVKGEKVDVFVSWLWSQKDYDPQFWPVKKMMEFWPSAFGAVSTQNSLPVTIDENGFPETY